jgi:nucleoside 2-deoxyribosyltransferase
MSFWYLATPYSKYPGGLEAAYLLACKQTALLIKSGVAVFCPIAHSHGPAIHGEIPLLDHDIWLPFDKTFMNTAKGMIYLTAESHDRSYGMGYELGYFINANKPVIRMAPNILPEEFNQ